MTLDKIGPILSAHGRDDEAAAMTYQMHNALRLAAEALDQQGNWSDHIAHDDRPPERQASDLLYLVDAYIEQSRDPESEYALILARTCLRAALAYAAGGSKNET